MRLRVEERDHDQRDDVVDDGDRQQERAQPVGEARPDEREQAERERGVGRHRHPPPVRRRTAGIEREVDRDRAAMPAERREHRQREPAPLAQLAEVELAPRLEADDEEEERHQAAVHPVAKVELRSRSRRAGSKACRPRGTSTNASRRSPRRARRPSPRAGPPRRRSRSRRNSRSGVGTCTAPRRAARVVGYCHAHDRTTPAGPDRADALAGRHQVRGRHRLDLARLDRLREMAGDEMAVQLTQVRLLVRAARRLNERTARVKPARVRRVRRAR